MNDAYILIGDIRFTLHGLIMAAAMLAAVTVSLAAATVQKKSCLPVLWTGCASILPALFLSHMVYWFFRPTQFDGFADALATFTKGGYSLLGAAAGICLCALLTRPLRLTDRLGTLFDALAPGAAVGISIGRLAGFFSSDDRGMLVDDPSMFGLPATVYDEQQEGWRLAVFLYESIAAGVIAAIVFALLFAVYRCRRYSSCRGSGAVCLVFTALYGTTQVVLESLRSDSLFMRTLGFVRVTQIAAVFFMVIPLAVFSRRAIKRQGMNMHYAVIWTAALALLGTAFYMELRMHSEVRERNYTIMSLCVLTVFAFTLYFFDRAYRPDEHKRQEPKAWSEPFQRLAGSRDRRPADRRNERFAPSHRARYPERRDRRY